MDLEEAQARITELEGEISTLTDTHTTALSDLTATHDKAIQKSYNQGFDKAKNASKDEVKDGYVKKEDVEDMLSKRDLSHKRQSLLSKMGIKNPSRAMKSIDEDDLTTLGSEDFDEEKFRAKYEGDFVFSGDKKDGEKPPKKSPSNFTKNNQNNQKAELTAESYNEMSAEEQAKVSTAEKLALL